MKSEALKLIPENQRPSLANIEKDSPMILQQDSDYSLNNPAFHLKRTEGIANKLISTIAEGTVNAFVSMWNRLVYDPQSIPQNEDVPLSHYMMNSSVNSNEQSLLKTVMAEILKVKKDSLKIAEALKNSVKIFHEDFPGSYILEYNGERLGAFSLDYEDVMDAQMIPVYSFNPEIKTFKWMC